MEGGEKDSASGVDAGLEARGGAVDTAVDSVEAAEEPFAVDEAVDEVAGARGGGGVEIVVFAGELGAFGRVFPGEDWRFCEDSRAEVGRDDAVAARRGGCAAGMTAVGAGGGGLGLASHGYFSDLR